MKAIKGIVIAIIVIIIIAVVAFLTLNKKSLATSTVVSKATNSSVAQGVANTPADTNNIVSPKDDATTSKENSSADKAKTDKSTHSNKVSNISNNTESNKSTTSATQNNNITKNSDIANNTKANNSTSNNNNDNSNNVSSKNTNIPVSTNKTTNNNSNNINNTETNSAPRKVNNKSTNTSNSQNLQTYYLNQLTQVTEQINAMSTKNDDDAQLLQNYGTQCNMWNGELNKIMNKLSTTLPSSQADNLQNEEFQWIQNRNNEVQNTSNGGGSIAPILGAQKEAQLTKERCYYLVNNYM